MNGIPDPGRASKAITLVVAGADPQSPPITERGGVGALGRAEGCVDTSTLQSGATPPLTVAFTDAQVEVFTSALVTEYKRNAVLAETFAARATDLPGAADRARVAMSEIVGIVGQLPAWVGLYFADMTEPSGAPKRLEAVE